MPSLSFAPAGRCFILEGSYRPYKSPTLRKAGEFPGVSDDDRTDYYSRNRMFLLGGCGAAAKRQGSGLGGRFWRHGIADGFRSAWFGDSAFESHNDCGGGIY